MDAPVIRARSDPGRINVGRTERWTSLAAGTALTLHGLRRGGPAGALETLVGATLVYRGATGHCFVYGALGASTAPDSGAAALSPVRRFVHLHHALTVQRSADELYRVWRDLERLPEIMEHLESVSVLDERRSVWTARAPLGRVQWEAEIVEDLPGERLSWRSVEGSDVANSGAVHFRPAPADRGTEVRVSLEYAPPAGKLGDVVSRIFGENPEQQIRDDLRRFKQRMETGEVPTTRGQPAGPRGLTLVGTVIP